jgi:hypothetical protein
MPSFLLDGFLNRTQKQELESLGFNSRPGFSDTPGLTQSCSRLVPVGNKSQTTERGLSGLSIHYTEQFVC